jgi:hypothetical protein
MEPEGSLPHFKYSADRYRAASHKSFVYSGFSIDGKHHRTTQIVVRISQW